mgnify:FL=1
MEVKQEKLKKYWLQFIMDLFYLFKKKTLKKIIKLVPGLVTGLSLWIIRKKNTHSFTKGF